MKKKISISDLDAIEISAALLGLQWLERIKIFQ